MKLTYLIVLCVLMYSAGYSQSKHSPNKEVSITKDTELSLSSLSGGGYVLNYKNSMAPTAEMRSILFKNKKEAKAFIQKVGKALNGKDGVSELIVYGNYRIRLLTELGGVFMIVDESGQSQATCRIPKESYAQMNTL